MTKSNGMTHSFGRQLPRALSQKAAYSGNEPRFFESGVDGGSDSGTVRALITGAAESPYVRHAPAGTTTAALLADAARRALGDAGIAPRDVDGLGVASFSLAPDHAVDLAIRLGLRVRWLMDAATGGASGLDLLQHARRAVEAGDARNILLVSGDHLEPEAFLRLVDEYNASTHEFLTPLPTGGPNALFAMLIRRHMAKHGLDRADYGTVAVAQPAWAGANPGAVYRGPLSLEEYLNARVVADPLCIPQLKSQCRPPGDVSWRRLDAPVNPG